MTMNNILEMKTGDRVDMEQGDGDKEDAVAVFRSSNGYYIHATIDSLVDGGAPIEYEGKNEGDDMYYIGTGFLV